MWIDICASASSWSRCLGNPPNSGGRIFCRSAGPRASAHSIATCRLSLSRKSPYADADDDEQESAQWRCGNDGCYKVEDGDEAIEEDYYDDDYEQEGASD